MFERPHHQRIAHVLASLDGSLLSTHGCLFGGGTCIALRYGEYRESVDMDFLVSDAAGFRELRALLTGPLGLNAIVRAGAQPLVIVREMRADQYGIRTQVQMDGQAIKFEIVREARIGLEAPSAEDAICDIGTLTPLDMAASKLLANSDRHADDGVFSRDIFDLAMIGLPLAALRAAVAKAETAYGTAVLRDLGTAIEQLRTRPGWLERCMGAMSMHLPKAVLWQRVRALRRVLHRHGITGAPPPIPDELHTKL